ncbi:MAG: hypothetical protein KME32_26650 [Mojavia pulchra JT2-VF2]|uniref:Uncharacterized protein n=1 Tax=Mojavia pulchra JT2-VF2 TaxID=287848 RepID=A0A951Q3L2_9NOST|nr:hypothetical protein [Mojavia pulchra JT2-VF2]
MKALSVRQPWAYAIIYAHKDIENRGWPIHALCRQEQCDASEMAGH